MIAMSPLRPAIAAAALVCFAGPAVAESVTLEMGLRPDRVERFSLLQEITVEQAQPSNGGEAKYVNRFEVEFDLRIRSVERDGSASGVISMRKYNARSEDPSGPASLAFDFSTDDPAPGLASAIADAQIMIDIDSAGNVTEVRGTDKILAAAEETQGLAPELVGFFSPDRLADLATMLFDAQGGLGEHELGESWETSRAVPIGRAGQIEITARSTVQLVMGGMAVMGTQFEYELMVPREPNEQTPRVTLGQTTGDTLTNWDLDEGMLLTHSSRQQIETSWTLGDIAMTQRQDSLIRITRVARD